MTRPLYYVEAQSLARARLGVRRSAAELLSIWEGFVSECEDCFRRDVSEYQLERMIRDDLAKIASAPGLETFSDHSVFLEMLERLDVRFRATLNPGVEIARERGWWNRGVQRRAGEPYVRFMRDAHGIEVALCGGDR